MEYNNHLLQLSEKYKRFFTDTTPGQILVMVCPYTFEVDYSSHGLKSRPLSSWDFEHELEAFALYCKQRHDVWTKETRTLDNDYFPALSVNFGYGAHSAYFSGQEVTMGIDTSWTHPCIENWSDLSKLHMDENNLWYQRILSVTRLFVKWQNGDYAVSGFSNAGPGDMANALRGNDIFTDLYDEPESVHALFSRCVEPTVHLENAIRSITGDVNGGSVTANCWFPGRVPYLSGDFNDLCAKEIFEAYDAVYMQKVIDAFDGAFIHHHMKGRHVHSAIARLKGLKLLEISWDPNLPRPIDCLESLYEENNGIPLMVRCHAKDLQTAIPALQKSRTIIMLNADTLDEAKAAVRLVRKNSIL